jgi:hypothetical protein
MGLDANCDRFRHLLIQELSTPLGSVPHASVVAGRRPLIIELDALRFPAQPSPAAVAARDVYTPRRRDRRSPTSELTSVATALAEATALTASAAAVAAAAAAPAGTLVTSLVEDRSWISPLAVSGILVVG